MNSLINGKLFFLDTTIKFEKEAAAAEKKKKGFIFLFYFCFLSFIDFGSNPENEFLLTNFQKRILRPMLVMTA